MGSPSMMPDPIRAASSERSPRTDFASWPRRHPLSSILLLLLVAALVYTLPPSLPRKPFTQASAWGLVVLASFIGYGSLTAWLAFRRRRIDVGLRAAWGAAALCFVGGLLASVSLMKFDVALVLVILGTALCGVAVVRDGDGVERWRRLVMRIARREPLVFGWGLLCIGVVALLYFGAVADWHVNPYDDDVAYLPFVKRLFDTGSLIEPFSFRRLSALGGQSFFLELVGVRALPTQGHTFDHGIALIMVVLLLWGHRSNGRRLSLVFLFLTTIFFLTLPSMSINTGSYFSGVVFFLALFRTLVLHDETESPNVIPLGLLAAATCTLRQNYLPVPILILGASAWFLYRRSRRLREPLRVAAVSAIALAPWLILSWRSNHTFLYPLMHGTFNTAIPLADTSMTGLREIKNQVGVALEIQPLRILPLLVVVAALLREKGARKPLDSLLFASVFGFIMIVHSFSQGDSESISRYVFGFVAAFAIAVLLTTGISFLRERSQRMWAAGGLAVLAVVAQLMFSGETLFEAWGQHFDDIEAAYGAMPESSRFDGWTYDKLQAAVPPGERMAVMLDQPYYLRFDRNPIFNLDMPGIASLPPGLPFFRGSEAVRDYFRKLQVRYVAFVRGEFSRYQYRRADWVERIVNNDLEFWRVHGPYVIDLLDNFTELAKKHRVLFEDHGMVVIDLEAS